MSLRLGVLASGAGTNLSAIHEAVVAGRLDAVVAVVVCNVPGADVLDRAAAAGLPSVCIDHRDHARREDFDAAVVASLREHRVEWVVLAGFMRLITPTLIDAFEGRVLNIHPSLLPAFPGIRAATQAVDHGVKISGCTVHLVDSGTDTGPILAQAAVPVRPDDDAGRLGRRIQAEEHRLYPQVLQWIAEGRLVRSGGRAYLDGAPMDDDALRVPSPAPAPQPATGSESRR